MILNDRQIIELCNDPENPENPLISPMMPKLVRHVDSQRHAVLFGAREEDLRVISFGLSSYGYDLTLGDEFKIFRHIPGTVVNPKDFNPENVTDAPLHFDKWGKYFILPAHSYGLGVSVERLCIPKNVTALFIGKSTYARSGIIVNLTPGEACLHPESEVLCRSGWKPIESVLIGEEVLCLEDGQSVYQPVQDFHRYYFNGDLLSFQSKFVSQIVTPQHKMWAAISKRRVMADCTYPSGRIASVNRKASMVYPFERIEADKIFGKHNVYLSREVDWIGSRHEDDIRFGNRCYPISTWLKFLGCWLGDGSAFIQGGGNYVIKLAVVTKEKKREYFRSVLDEMGVNYYEGKRGFEFRHKATCLYLMQYKGARNKRVPREYMSLPPDQLSLIRDGLMRSDGNLETSTFVSTSKQLIDDFQELSIKIGDYATVWSCDNEIRGKKFKAFACRYSSRGSTPSKVLPENCQKVPYSGFVYDLTVPSHVFLVRHNGRVSWTGNSWRGHLTIEISNSSSADCRIYAGEGICQALFFEGLPCETAYGDDRKYQNQPASVVLPRV